MTETRTTRFGLPIWGAGADGPSRADFNEAFTNLEARGSYDDGTPVSTLPTTGLFNARYFWQVQQPGGGVNPTYRTLWRSDGTTLYPVGGPTITTTQLYRGLHSSVSGSADNDALRIEHASNPDDGGWGGNITYAGAAYLRTGLALGDDDDTTVGRLAVGAFALPASTVRFSVDSYGSGEHAVVARVRHATPGNIFRGLNAANNPVFTVDGTGRVLAPKPSAFGGAGLPSTATLAVAPTSGVDGITGGLLLYGLTAAGHVDDVAKSILKVQPDSADSAAIAIVNRLNIQLGRIAWGTPGVAESGTLRFDANSFTFRTTGSATGAGRAYLHFRRSDPAAENDLAQDTLLAAINPGNLASELPTVLTQRAFQASPTLSLARVGNFSSSFLEVYRLVPDGLGGETVQPAGSLLSDGRLRTGAWWRATGTMRDARQSILHHCVKVWAAVGAGVTAGQAVAQNGTFSYIFPVMTVRSVDVADLLISLETEILLGIGAFSTRDDAQIYNYQCFVSINGGTYAQAELTQQAATVTTGNVGVTSSGARDNVTYMLQNVAGGATFQIKITTNVGAAAATVYLRKYALNVEEAIIETYVAA